MADRARKGSGDNATSNKGPDSSLKEAEPSPDPSDLELLAKLEEANR